MPKYEVTQYELHYQTYTIEADSAAEAIAEVLSGNVDASDNGSEYIQTADNYGIPTTEQPELAARLRDLGFKCDDMIRSICSVKELNALSPVRSEP